MLSAMVLLCAGATASASGFYEPVDNVHARPFYKSPPHVSQYEHNPHPVHKTHTSYTPQAPAYKLPVPVFEPTEHIPEPVYEVPAYKATEAVTSPVHRYEPPQPEYHPSTRPPSRVCRTR